MTTDLVKFAEEKGVKYFMVSYTDIFGAQRAKLVPTAAIGEMQEDGAGFAGFSTYLKMSPADPDMLAIPDRSAAIQLPWKPDVAWVPANLMMEGEEVAQAPRNVLRRMVAEADALGLRVKTGIEAEFFFVVGTVRQVTATPRTTQRIRGKFQIALCR